MHCDAASAQSEWTELLKKLGNKREAPQMIDGLLRELDCALHQGASKYC